ncbi:MAG: hypothetical protein PHR35_09210 [Kiritimatiellae bacterium]|nr:hypothetical protein [Kiritimatiellia bacterium]
MRVDLKIRLLLWLSANWLLALISLGVAVVVYFTVRENISYTDTRTVAVTVDHEDGLALTAIRPASVRVTFRGSLNELRQLDRRDPRFVLRPPRAGAAGGTEHKELRQRHLRGASGLRIVMIDPPVVEITFDHQGEREFAIAPPVLQGRPLRGRAEVDYTPRTAIVRGARLQLDRLHGAGISLQPEPVNVEGRVQSFTQRVAIMPPEDAWQPEIVPAEILVRIDIIPESAQREFDGVPVRLALPTRPSPGGTIVAAPPLVKVRLTGLSETLQGLTTNDLRVYADGDDTAVEVPLRVFLPAGIALDSAVTDPPSVRLTPRPATP